MTAIGPASTFSWTPAPVAGADTCLGLLIDQVLDDARTASVVCLEDDGAFGFSAETRADMAAGLTAGTLVLGDRSSLRTYTEGDAALVLTVSRGTVYASPAAPPAAPPRYREQLRRLLGH